MSAASLAYARNAQRLHGLVLFLATVARRGHRKEEPLVQLHRLVLATPHCRRMVARPSAFLRVQMEERFHHLLCRRLQLLDMIGGDRLLPQSAIGETFRGLSRLCMSASLATVVLKMRLSPDGPLMATWEVSVAKEALV